MKTVQQSEYPELSIILPCLNEEHAIMPCLSEIEKILDASGISAEIIIVDNGSTDGSAVIIEKAAAQYPRVVPLKEKRLGYGSAYLCGLKAARGDCIFMADIDGTYNFNDIPAFVKKLKDGNDFVVGNRFSGTLEKGVMPWHHKRIGNPVLAFLIRIFFGSKIGDPLCGSRIIRKDVFEKLDLHTTGMEFSAEMIIKALKRGFSVVEIPIVYRPRIGQSKLKSFSDGWRYIRFILLYSPIYLFLLPGAIFFVAGVGILGMLYFTTPSLFGIKLVFHPMFVGTAFVVIGYQLSIFAVFSKIYAITHLKERDFVFEKWIQDITLEKALVVGSLFALVGTIMYALIMRKWIESGYGSLDEIKNSIVALTLLIIGIQTFFSGFMISILGIKEN